MSHIRNPRTLIALIAASSLGLGACASMSKKEQGAATGAAAGAAIGGIVGNQTGSTARGAIIGAIVGGAAGAVIGHQMDQQAKELEQKIDGARIDRVGEGIAVTFDSGILFPFNSTDILPAGRANLQELARSLQQYPNSDVLVVGHTDNVGSDNFNDDLSRRRASAAGSYLQSLGVPSSRIRTVGRGESEPVLANDTDDQRARNRRVEVAIYASEAYRNQVKNR